MRHNSDKQHVMNFVGKRSVLFAAIAIAAIALLAFSAQAASTLSLEYGGYYATYADAEVTSETAYWGEGSWKATPGVDTNGDGYDKFEWYFYWTPGSTHNLGNFTIDDIENIVYHTNKSGAQGDPDFYLLIYTVSDGVDDHGWYGYRLNAEPYFSNNLDAPANQWNEWNTDTGANQLTFFDSWKSGTYGFYGQPTLQDLQAGAINWQVDYGYGEDQDIDYGSEQVKGLCISTGSSWSGTFDGYLDAVSITLTNGTSVTIDLENEVWVDDNYDSSTPGWQMDHFDSIQDAIDAVGNGGTAHVAAGTYSELIYMEGRNGLTIKSTDGAASTIIDAKQTGESPPCSPSTPAHPAFYVRDCENITIEGFTIQDVILDAATGDIYQSTDPYLMTSVLLYSSSNCTVKNNILYNFYYGIFLCGEAGLGACNDNLIVDNEVDGNNVAWYGINMYDDDTVDGMENNAISSNTVQNCYYNIYAGYDAVNTTITDNTITGSPDLVDYFPGYTYTDTPQELDDGYGIRITGDGVASDGTVGGHLVSNNIVSDCKVGILLNTFDVIVEANTIYDNINGIGIDDYIHPVTGIEIRHNNIYGNTDNGVLNIATTVVDATCNWWGDASGPYHLTLNPDGQGDNVSDNVDFSPWLDASYPGGEPYADVFIDKNNNGQYDDGEPAFYSIQDAIDDADEYDTVKVEPGEYRENLVINKPLKIVGDPIINANGSAFGVLIQANDTLFQNYTVYNFTSAGIYVHNASFIVKNVTIDNCIVTNSSYNTGTYGIHFNGVNDSMVNNSHVTNASIAGIYPSSSSNNAITGNTVNSNGQYGIYLTSNSNNNTISSNQLSNNNYSTYPHSAIFLDHVFNNTVINNNVSNNNGFGIFVMWGSDTILLNNNVVNNTMNGIRIDVSSNIVVNNTVNYNNESGIFFYGAYDCFIENNTVSYNNKSGIDLQGGSQNITVVNNTVQNNRDNGIFIYGLSNNNTVTGTTVSNNRYGIGLYFSSNCTITDSTLSGNGEDITVHDSPDNLFLNNTVSSYPTTFDITSYSGDFTVSGVESPPADPPHMWNISKYLDITSLSEEAWVNVSIHYDDADIGWLSAESTLEIYKHNGSWYRDGWSTYKHLDTTNNVITANISDFGSIFAPLLQDTTAPTTTKDVGQPNYGTNAIWVNSSTPIWLDATDNTDGSGVNATYYRIWYDGGWHPAGPNDYYCTNENITLYNGTYYYVYYNESVDFGPIYFHEECVHYIEFFSVDNATNEEEHTVQVHFVDNTPPEVTKEYGQPQYEQGENHYITSDTPIYLNASDSSDAITKLSPGVPIVWPFWEVFGDTQVNATIHNFADKDVTVDIYYVNLTDTVELENLTWKNMEDNITGWSDISSFSIHSNAETEIPVAIEQGDVAVLVRYNVSIDGDVVARFIGEIVLDWEGGVPSIVGTLTNFDVHNNFTLANNFELEIMGIEPSNITEWYYGWGSPPNTTYDGTWLNITWINITDPVDYCEWKHFGLRFDSGVNQTDISDMVANWTMSCAVGSYQIWYRVYSTAAGTWTPWQSGLWNESVIFTLAGLDVLDNCTHYIEYYAVDDLGNNYTEPFNQTIYVDNTDPVIDITVGDPNVTGGGTPQYWVNFSTPITINVTDLGCCPNMTVMWNNGTGWNIIYDTDATLAYETTFFYDEECQHWLNVTAFDCLGHRASLNWTIYVDNTPPVSTIEPFDSYCQNVTDSNPLTINATITDYPLPCASGVRNATLWYRYARYNHSFTDWFVVSTDEDGAPWQWQFTAPNGSGYYQFYVAAYDNLGHHEPYPPDESTTPLALLSVSYNYTFDFVYNHTGWNLFTLPVKQPSLQRASHLIAYVNSVSPDTCTVVTRWLRTEQRYQSYVALPDGNSSGTDFVLVPGEGYFVYVTRNVTGLYLEGCLIEYGEIALALRSGYSLIGWANLESVRASQLAGNISGCTKIALWNATTQGWEPEYIVGLPGGDMDVVFGRALFAFRPETTPVNWDGGRGMLTLPPP